MECSVLIGHASHTSTHKALGVLEKRKQKIMRARDDGHQRNQTSQMQRSSCTFDLTVTVIASIQIEHLNQAKTQHTELGGWGWAYLTIS